MIPALVLLSPPGVPATILSSPLLLSGRFLHAASSPCHGCLQRTRGLEDSGGPSHSQCLGTWCAMTFCEAQPTSPLLLVSRAHMCLLVDGGFSVHHNRKLVHGWNLLCLALPAREHKASVHSPTQQLSWLNFLAQLPSFMSLVLRLLKKYLFTCGNSLLGSTHASVRVLCRGDMWRSEDSLQDSVLSFHPVGSGDGTLVVKVSRKPLAH